MSLISISNSLPPVLSNNIKVLALEKTLLQGLDNFKGKKNISFNNLER